jgi:hypothetical protein
MPTFEITSPDGKTYEVTAPEGATHEQVLAYAQSQYKPAVTNTAPNEKGALESAFIGAGKTLTQLGRGVQQAYYGATGDDKAQAALKAKVDEEAALYKPLADKHGLATGIGEALPVLAGGPLTMAAAGGLEYGTPAEKALRAGAGFVGGKAGELVGKGIGRVAQPIRSATADATQALFDKYGISGLPGQITGSAPMQWLESTIAKLPGGGRVRANLDAQSEGLGRAAMGSMGAEGSAVTPEAVQAAKRALGDVFQNTPKGQTVAIDQTVAERLIGVEQNHLKNLSPDQRSIVQQYVSDILAHGENGMPGDVYQKARSRIAARANSTQDSELKTALTGIYKTLDDAFVASASPEASAAMKTARGQWQAAKTLEPMAQESGVLSPARVANGAKGMPGQLGDLAKLGSKMKGLPDSGTAQRLFYQQLLSGGGGAAYGLYTGDPMEGMKAGLAMSGGQLAGPWLASQMLTREPTKKYLTKGLLNVTPEIEEVLKRLGIAGGGLLGYKASR